MRNARQAGTGCWPQANTVATRLVTPMRTTVPSSERLPPLAQVVVCRQAGDQHEAEQLCPRAQQPPGRDAPFSCKSEVCYLE